MSGTAAESLITVIGAVITFVGTHSRGSAIDKKLIMKAFKSIHQYPSVSCNMVQALEIRWRRRVVSQLYLADTRIY